MQINLDHWPEVFYQTEDINRRESLLLERLNQDNNSDDQERLRIFHKRFENESNHQRPDRFMRAWLLIPVAFQSYHQLFSKNSVQKELIQYYKELCVLEEDDTDFLIEEWKIFAQKLITSCANDKQYNSYLFGLAHLSEEATAKKILSDIDSITYYIPKELGIETNCSPFRKVMLQTFVQTIPNGHHYLEDVEESL